MNMMLMFRILSKFFYVFYKYFNSSAKLTVLSSDINIEHETKHVNTFNTNHFNMPGMQNKRKQHQKSVIHTSEESVEKDRLEEMKSEVRMMLCRSNICIFASFHIYKHHQPIPLSFYSYSVTLALQSSFFLQVDHTYV